MSSCRAALHLAKSLSFTDTTMKMGMLSVNGLPEKWRLRTKRSKIYGQIRKNGALSVKFERNLGAPPRIRKNPRHHGTNFNHYSVDRSASQLVPTKQTVPPLLPKATKPKCLTTANKERFWKSSRFSHDQQCS